MQTTPTRTKEKHVLASANTSLSKHRKRNKTLGIMGCILIGVLVIANIIVRSMSSRTEVAITNVHFSKNTIDISAGDSVPFKNTTRTTYFLCLGQNAKCIDSGNGPTELYSPGLAVAPGKTSSVTFAAPGTYAITALHSSAMNLVVTVNKAEDTSGSGGGDTNDSIIIVPQNSTSPSDTNSSSTNNNTSSQQNTDDNNSNVTSPSNSGSDDENSGSSSGSSDDSGGGSGGGGDDGGGGGDGGDGED